MLAGHLFLLVKNFIEFKFKKVLTINFLNDILNTDSMKHNSMNKKTKKHKAFI